MPSDASASASTPGTAGEGTQNQAIAGLVGLAVHAATGLDWVDPVIALILAVRAVQEGRAAWEGEECC